MRRSPRKDEGKHKRGSFYAFLRRPKHWQAFDVFVSPERLDRFHAPGHAPCDTCPADHDAILRIPRHPFKPSPVGRNGQGALMECSTKELAPDPARSDQCGTHIFTGTLTVPKQGTSRGPVRGACPLANLVLVWPDPDSRRSFAARAPFPSHPARAEPVKIQDGARIYE